MKSGLYSALSALCRQEALYVLEDERFWLDLGDQFGEDADQRVPLVAVPATPR